MLSNFLSKVDGSLIAIIALDAVLILAIAGLFVWYYLKKRKSTDTVVEEKVERLNETTALPQEAAPVEEPKVYEDDNAVLHFVNQITDINEEANTELNSSAVIVNHEVEQHTRKAVDKQAINNFVEIGGEKKTLNEEDIAVIVEDTPLGRIGLPLDVAKTALFLCTDDASFITGDVINVSGGLVI